MPAVLDRPLVETEEGFDDELDFAPGYSSDPEFAAIRSQEEWTRYVQKKLKEARAYDAQHSSIPWDEAWNRIKARHPDVRWD